MSTPVSFIVAIDGSTKLREYVSDINQFVESAMQSLLINDDLGFVLITNITRTVVPLAILRPQNQGSLKLSILKEICASQDSTVRGQPSKPFMQSMNLLAKRSPQDQWRPAYIMLITDGRPDDNNVRELFDLAIQKSNDTTTPDNVGPIYLDVY